MDQMGLEGSLQETRLDLVNEKNLRWKREWLDPSIYDHSKSVKPDILAHFDAEIFPKMLDSTTPFSMEEPDQNVIRGINDFWMDAFKSVCSAVENGE